MCDKKLMLERVEALLGDAGSSAQAEQVFALLQADGYITFDPQWGYVDAAGRGRGMAGYPAAGRNCPCVSWRTTQ